MAFFPNTYFPNVYFDPSYFNSGELDNVICDVDQTLPGPICTSIAILVGVADYSTSKPAPNVWPAGAVESSWKYRQPLLTPEQLISRYLWGINLQSKYTNPLTGKPWEITLDMLQDRIEGALEQAEQELNIQIAPIVVTEKMPFARADWAANGYFGISRAFPIDSIESMAFTFANDVVVWNIPLEWVETANLYCGQINLWTATGTAPYISPDLSGDLAANGIVNANLFFNAFNNARWVQALVEVTYTAGFPNGIPRAINDFIGTMAALDIISQLLASLSRSVSAGLSMDGWSQNTSAVSPIFLRGRLDDLKEERERMKKRIKAKLRNFVSSAV